MKTKTILIFLLITWISTNLFSQTSHYEEYTETIKTYPFSDPNPFPIIEKNNTIYPYYRFDGFSHTGKAQEWKMVKLENDYIIVYILPEMGGKLWGAIDKKTGKEFIYKNDVIKFRDVAQRGPWTSGGIEFNSGVIGHFPGGATPVDYRLFIDDSGAAHCVIGGTDLPSHTTWRVDIVVPPNVSYFETNSQWYNATPFHQSCYYWSNAAVKSADDLHFYFPGNYWLGHNGVSHPWPINEQGIDRSWYKNNRDNEASSYHIFGSIDNYYVSFFHDEHFGSGHWSPAWGTPGKKIWLWPQSRSGAIWEDLLTDTHGQYVEVQAGRMFNQNDISSGQTPFKQTSFMPFNADRWTERWFPVSEMDGVTRVSESGTIYLINSADALILQFCPIRKIHEPLIISINGKTISEETIELKPSETLKKTFSGIDPNSTIEISLGKETLFSSKKDFTIHRPVKSPTNALADDYLLGVELVNRRYYTRALKTFLKFLEKESSNLDALSYVAELYYYREETDKAMNYCRKALEINAYHSWANFVYANIAKDNGNFTDAKDGFRFSMRSLEYRSASLELLAEMSLINGNITETKNLAQNALDFNRRNMNSYMVLAIAHRKSDDKVEATKTLDQILSIDPLNHFALFEKSLLNPGDISQKTFTNSFFNEMTVEEYLEIGLFYAKLGLADEAVDVLSLAPKHPTVYYWLAYLTKDQKTSSDSFLDLAIQSNPKLVFPYRIETLKVLGWANTQQSSWKTDYYRALILWNRGRKEEALKYMKNWMDEPDFEPFYYTRAYLEGIGSDAALKDMKQAISVNPEQWRLYKELALMYQQRKNYPAALEIIEQGQKKFKGNFIFDLVYAQTLALLDHHVQSLKILEKINVLPFEGENSAHNVYVYDNLMLAIANYNKGKYNKTLLFLEKSELYSENLGSGKVSYPDYRVQNFIRAKVYEKQGKKNLINKSYNDVINYTNPNMHGHGSSPGRLAEIFVLINSGKEDQGKNLAHQWAKENTDLLSEWVSAKTVGDEKKRKDLEKEILEKETSANRYLTAKLIFSFSEIQ